MIFTDNNAAKPMLREQAKQMAPFHYGIMLFRRNTIRFHGCCEPKRDWQWEEARKQIPLLAKSPSFSLAHPDTKVQSINQYINPKMTQTKASTATTTKRSKKELATDSKAIPTGPVEEHLPPLPLVFFVLFCSGFLLLFGLRDFMMTGRNIMGNMDEKFLVSIYFLSNRLFTLC